MTKKEPWYLLRKADGEKSLSATVVLIPFWVIMILYTLSAFESLGPIKIREFNVEGAGMLLSMTLANYWGRRHTETKAAVATGKLVAPKDPANKEEQGGD